MSNFEVKIENAVNTILADYANQRDIDQMDFLRRPDNKIVKDMVCQLWKIIFPGVAQEKDCCSAYTRYHLFALIENVMFRLNHQVALARQSRGESAHLAQKQAQQICLEFFRTIPYVRALVQMDVQAFYDGDPAATGKDEIIFSYPGLFAIVVYRLAHVLHGLDVPVVPRMMTEYAHSATGIDIHPGATVGECFFIDHGTGIVIGETTVIGNRVKLYQGVTLGALTTRGGQSLRGKRRHPTIEDRVTIYAGASILGGETVIGHDSVIGSNAFITHSIAPGTTVRVRNQEFRYQMRPTTIQSEEVRDPDKA